MKNNLPIKDLVQRQQAALGALWIAVIQDPKRLPHMVDEISGHVAESMKLSYSAGLAERDNLLVRNIPPHS